MNKLKVSCDKYNPCQEPENPNTICYNCGFLRFDHLSEYYPKDQFNIFIETDLNEIEKQ